MLPEGTSPDDLVVHQQDVQAVVNALWAGGAEAMQIMDQRVISTSAVRCVGNTLILQGRVYSPPYEITAIGDPDRLYEALDAAPRGATYRYYVDTYGLVYETRAAAQTTLPGYDGSLELMHARVASVIRTAVRGLGELLITAGLVVLLFVAYQLVWTNFEAHRAADQVADDIRDDWTPARRGGTTGAPAATPVDFGKGFAFLHIPRLGKHWSVPVVEGVALPDLARGVGHYPTTARPGAGRQLRGGRAPGHQRRAVRRPGPGAQGRRRGRRDPQPAGSPTSSTGPGS